MITVLALALLPGLKITDIKVGTGPAAKNGDVLTMLYRGTLKDGKSFDGNIPDKGKKATKPPYAFKLGAGTVIQGWEKGLVGMKVGGKRRLAIPAAMGYGKNKMGDIPANSDLYFDVELLRIDNDATAKKLVVKEVKGGSGQACKKGDTISVLYKGMFLNGFVFDSNQGKAPYDLQLGSGMVIKGFDQGLTGMKKGGKRLVTIPYELAYRVTGRPPVIPPYSTLVFELELAGIKK